jgi:nucleotide-binding universal stress UspA family protein
MTRPTKRLVPYTVLCAVDGSPGSDRALDLIAKLPIRAGDEVVVASYPPYLLAVRSGGEGIARALGAAAERRAHQAVDEARARLAASRVDARGVVCDGESAADALLRVAEREHAELLVVGSRGRGPWASILLGSTARALVLDSSVPVLVVREPKAPHTVVAATDGSPSARSALKAFSRFPQSEGTLVELLHVLPAHDEDFVSDDEILSLREAHERAEDDQAREVLEEQRTHLARGLESRTRIERGHAGETILSRARAIGADLIVVGSRGTGLPRRLFWGSTAERVVTQASCNVLVAAAPAAED